MGLKLNDVPAAAGLRWVTLAATEYFRHPLAYTALFMSFLLALLLAMALPAVGGLLLLVVPPLLSLGFMMAAHASQKGAPPRLGVFAVPWKRQVPDRRRALLALLLVYAALVAGTMWLGQALSDGGLGQWFAAYAKGDTPAEELNRLSELPGVAAGMLWCVALIALISLVFWFSPALVLWAGQGPAQAMFSSALALWRAKGAFLNYGLLWVGASVAMFVLGSLLGALAGPAVAALLIAPVNLAVTCMFYISLYFSFRDCFGEP
ncbi:MAG: BPSS1780 family membrane protein [Pseudomonadota bacterium]